MNAVFEDEMKCSRIIVRPVIMLQLLEHFRSRSSEVLLQLNSAKFSMKSYVTAERQLTTSALSNKGHNHRDEIKAVLRKAMMNTDINLSTEELETFVFHGRNSQSDGRWDDECFLFSAKEVKHC